MKNKYNSKLIWAIIGIYAIVNIILTIFGSILVRAATIGIGLSIFTYFHGTARYSKKDMLIFFILATVFGLIYENISILTGFPFGPYYYADFVGPKLFYAPILIAPAYFALGYLAWSITAALFKRYNNRIEGWNIFFLPLIASFVTVMMDFCLDPIWSTIDKTWIWQNGGSYFGVPFSNFLGWYLCVFTYMQLFSLYLSRKETIAPTGVMSKKSYWWHAIIMFCMSILQIPIMGIISNNTVVTTAIGQEWNTSDIYWSMTLISITTVVFVTLLGSINIYNSENLE